MIKCQNDIEPNVFVVNAEIYIWVGLTALCVQNAQKKVEYKTLSGKEPVLTVDASLKVAHGQDGVHNVEKLRKKKIQNIAKVLPYDHWEVWIPVSCAVNNILWWADDKNIALTVNMMLYLHGKGHTKLVTTSVQMSFRLRKSVGMKGRRYAYIAYVHFGIVQQATCAQTIAVSNNLECNNT